MAGERLLTIREASVRLGLRESTLRKWLLLKKIAYCKLGRSVRVPTEVVDKIIADGYRKPVEPLEVRA